LSRPGDAGSQPGARAVGGERRRMSGTGQARRTRARRTGDDQTGRGRTSDGSSTLLVREARTKQKLDRPRRYKVMLHNDDYTTREFVVAILQAIFHHSEVDATAIMLHIHNHGIGVAGVYPFEIAESKVAEVMRSAEEAEFPLLATTEPDEPAEPSE